MNPNTIKLPHGFSYQGLATGIKKSRLPDLAIVAADADCVAAGVYTQNLVRAASIDWNKKITPSDQVRAVVINSGNANACTGEQGIKDNQQIAVEAGEQLGARPEQVLVLSTGIIGHHLPMEKLSEGIKSAASKMGANEEHFDQACQAIITTDSGKKTARRASNLEGCEVRLAGMAKGAGMIGPRMATLLCVIVTDAKLEKQTAQLALKTAVDASFNRISVEGHTSTNDSVILLSSQSQNVAIDGNRLLTFTDELTSLCVDLARMIPRDGEGASHLITIDVAGAVNNAQADVIARTVANSNLVKTAIAGGDPNWGRIVSAVGNAKGVDLTPRDIRLHLNGFLLFQNGTPVPFDDQQVSQAIAANPETTIAICVGQGPGVAQHWTSDLTVDYVKFNSNYST